MAEVVVMGGGPGGAALAGLLAKRGREVVLIERARFPRFRVGESLLPQSCGIFAELGLLDSLEAQFVPKYGARFVSGATGQSSRYRFRDAFDVRFDHAYEVERKPFDTLLLQRAKDLGVCILQPARVEKVLFEDGRAQGVALQIDGAKSQLRASVVADASGRAAILGRQLGGVQRLPDLDCSSVFAHFRGVPRPAGEEAGDIVIVLFEKAWLWFIPLSDGITSVGAVLPNAMLPKYGDNEARLMAAVANSAFATDLLKNATAVNNIRAIADFSYRVEQLAGPGWLCVGDAAGFIDPLFSSGVHLALRSAGLAAEAIDNFLSGDPDALDGYANALKRASELFLGTVRAAYHGGFREMLFAEKQRPLLRQMITAILSGDVFHPPKEPTWVRFLRGRFPAI